jgi:hypothetical protein
MMEAMRRDPALAGWFSKLDAASPVQPEIPKGSELVDVLLDLAVPHQDINDVLRFPPAADPDTRWLLERSLALLLDGLGMPGDVPEFPVLVHATAPSLRYFYVWMYVAALPALRAWYEERDIPEEILRATVRDMGRQMALNRHRLGYGGLQVNASWPAYAFRGCLFQLGRLQFERGRVGGTTASEISRGGHRIVKGDPVIAVHIPDYSGPFDPASCDDSFARARAFFARYFPGETRPFVTCHSWLMARDLARYLPESSNILAFQRRFTINDRDYPVQDDDFFRFVFGTDASRIDDVPQDTSLQRAIVEHIRQGNHWRGAVGWCELDRDRHNP